MIRLKQETCNVLFLGTVCAFASIALGQNTTSSSAHHVGFDSADGWVLKYFTAATLLSGLQPPPPRAEEHRHTGSITVGLETDWIPSLSSDQMRNFNGRSQQDLNKAPVLLRPSVRIGLPWKFTAVASLTPPLPAYGVTPRLVTLGLERPLLERRWWTLGWRVSGQTGNVEAAFICPPRVLSSAPRSPGNPSGCLAPSADKAYLHYVGTELQFAYRIPRLPRLTPHVASGFNWVDSSFQVDAQLQNAQLQNRRDQNQLYTRGKVFSETAGVSYYLTDRLILSVDGFYSPLWVQRGLMPRTNDPLRNVRASLSYTFR